MWRSIAPSKALPARAAATLAASAAAIVGYALLSHWLMVNAANQPWAVAVLFGPLNVPAINILPSACTATL